MFFKLNLRKIVYVMPESLGSHIKRDLEVYLRSMVEGKYLEEVGLIVAVLDITNAETIDGRVLDDGRVAFCLIYEALVFRCFRGEVLDTKVVQVNAESFLADCGAMTIYVSKHQMPTPYVFEKGSGMARFATPDGDYSIEVGNTVRLRIISETPSRVGGDGFGAIGTIIGQYLGPRAE